MSCYALRMTTCHESLAEISQLAEQELLAHFERLVVSDRKNTARLLVAIAEVDERKLWAKRACSSMFVFCMRHHHMSEQVTAKRIWAARTARRFPVVLAMLARGELHLSAIHLLSRHLTAQNHVALLERVKHRSSRDVEKLIAEIAPLPDVPSRIRALPLRAVAFESNRGFAAAAREHVVQMNSRVGDGRRDVGRSQVTPPSRRPNKQIRALAPRRFKVEITVDQETHDKLRTLQDLLGHLGAGLDPAAVLSRAIDVLLEQTLKRKVALTDRPRPNVKNPEPSNKLQPAMNSSSAGSQQAARKPRKIPAAIRREVWLRDGGRCAFVDESGERCGAMRSVEFHHKRPFGKGGGHEVENIELRCRAHNQAQADLDFGVAFMGAKRRHTFPGECSRERTRTNSK
ncbi:MAG: 5-methylcytosine-specific restriction endonuclease McrA [Hyphomicrobiaceae bacterium]|jgi:5-methylcytosine-specific restriction endonuclease McrA